MLTKNITTSPEEIILTLADLLSLEP